MKGKYITPSIRLACGRKQIRPKQDIRQQIAETIEERNRILKNLAVHMMTRATINTILGEKMAA